MAGIIELSFSLSYISFLRIILSIIAVGCVMKVGQHPHSDIHTLCGWGGLWVGDRIALTGSNAMVVRLGHYSSDGKGDYQFHTGAAKQGAIIVLEAIGLRLCQGHSAWQWASSMPVAALRGK